MSQVALPTLMELDIGAQPTEEGQINWSHLDQVLPLLLNTFGKSTAGPSAPLGSAATAVKSPSYPCALIGDPDLLSRLNDNAQNCITRTKSVLPEACLVQLRYLKLVPGECSTVDAVRNRWGVIATLLVDVVNCFSAASSTAGVCQLEPAVVGGVKCDHALGRAIGEKQNEDVNVVSMKAASMALVAKSLTDAGVYEPEGAPIHWTSEYAEHKVWSVVLKLGMSMAWKGLRWGVIFGGSALAVLELRLASDGRRYLAISPFVRCDHSGPKVLPALLGLLMDASGVSRTPSPEFDIATISDERVTERHSLGNISTDKTTAQHHWSAAQNLGQVEDTCGSKGLSLQFCLPTFESLPFVLLPSIIPPADRDGNASIAEACINRHRLLPPHMSLSRRLGNGVVAEAYLYVQHGLVAKMAFNHTAIEALRHEAVFYETFLVGCRAVPEYYGMHEHEGVAAMVLRYAGEIVLHWTTLTDDQKSQVYAALRAIHSAGLRHGDLHEGNVLFSDTSVCIIDFTHAEPLDDRNAALDYEEIALMLNANTVS